MTLLHATEHLVLCFMLLFNQSNLRIIQLLLVCKTYKQFARQSFWK